MMLPKFKIRCLSSKYNALLNNLNLLLYVCSCIVITLVIAIQFLKIIAIQNKLYRDITNCVRSWAWFPRSDILRLSQSRDTALGFHGK